MTCVYFIITYVLVCEYFKYEIQKALGPRLSLLLFPVRVNTHAFSSYFNASTSHPSREVNVTVLVKMPKPCSSCVLLIS